MSYPTHTEIRDRFRKELDNILRFVDFLSSALALDRLTLHRVNSDFRTLGYDHVRLPTGGLTTEINPYDLVTLAPKIDAMAQMLPEIIKRYDAEENPYQNIVTHDVSEEHPKQFEQQVEYVTMNVPAKCDADTPAKLKAHLREKMENDGILSWIEKDQFNLFLEDAVAVAMKITHDFRRQAAYGLLENIEHLQFLATFSDADAKINAYRQNFILLMTAFDAAVFDLTRTALRRNFFPFISYFGKDAKVVLGDLGDFATIDEFIEFVTEAQLKRRYVKDVLGLLGEVDVQLVDTKAHKPIELAEMVLRRNLHVHNRGVVDQFYLDEKKNIHNLTRGQVAVIDEPYWNNAVSLCTDCIGAITEWIEKGAPVPKKQK